jgi:site-specific DNA-cytosine methylase
MEKVRTVLVSAFAGIGGFDLAGRMVGWESAVLCEIDPECQVVLRHHFPEAYIHGDIRTLTGKTIDEEIRKRYGGEPVRVVWTSGFPCQPFSAAGKREGTDDDRYLWPEVARIVGEYRFDAIVLENVFGLTSILEPPVHADMEREAVHAIRSCETGLFGEPAKREKVEVSFEVVQQRIMGRILEDIGEAGYECPTARDGSPVVLCVPACAVGAPHRRDRVWFVANRNPAHRHTHVGREHKVEISEIPGKEQGAVTTGIGEQDAPSDTQGVGHLGWQGAGIGRKRECLKSEQGQDAAIRGKLGGPGQLPATSHPANGDDRRDIRGKEERPEPELGGCDVEVVVTHPDRINGDLPGLRTGPIPFIQEAGIQPDTPSNSPITGHEERFEAGGWEDIEETGSGLEHEPERLGGGEFAAHTKGKRTQGKRAKGKRAKGKQVPGAPPEEGVSGCDDTGAMHGFWDNFPTEWPLRIGDDGLSAGLGGVCVPGTGRKVTAGNLNKFTLKAGGNAIVPHVAVPIFQTLQSMWDNRNEIGG